MSNKSYHCTKKSDIGIFIVFCDIVKSSSYPNNEVLCLALTSLWEIFNIAFDKHLSEFILKECTFVLPTGDGILFEIRFNNKKVKLENMYEKLLAFVVCFQLELKKQQIINKYNIPIRIGIHKGKANLIDFANQPQYAGLAIIEAQRLMDFGNEWQIFFSDDFFKEIPSAEDKDEIRGLWKGNILGLNLVGKYIGQRSDKGGINRKIFNLYDENDLVGSQKKPAIKRGFPVLTPGDFKMFESLIRNSTEFYSITYLPPEVWFTDLNLLNILILQARYNDTKLGLKKFERIIIWDDEFDDYHDVFKLLHKAAGVRCQILTVDSIKEKISSELYLEKKK